MKRGGRPPGPPEKRRKNVLRVRLTDDEIDALYRAAYRKAKTLGKYARELLVAPNQSESSVESNAALFLARR